MTTVPLTDAFASSLIWIGERDEIDALMRLDAPGFDAALAARLDGLSDARRDRRAGAIFPWRPECR